VYGIDSDTANAWAPFRASYASSGYIPLQAVSDSLFAVSDDGKSVPLLVESVENNADYTQWTLHIREGIKFQDGTPLDGAAVKFNLDSCIYSPLTAGAFTSVDHVEASGQDVTVFTKGGPWVALPTYLQYGSCGYMVSAKWLGSLKDVPQRNDKTPVYDAALAATPADGDPAKIVGLGAFKFESYTPGNGNAFRPSATPTTGAVRTASPVRTFRTSTRSKPSSPSTSTAGRTPSRPGSSTSCTPPTPTPSPRSRTKAS
jgi:ABC-type transport system substrate-binding protein